MKLLESHLHLKLNISPVQASTVKPTISIYTQDLQAYTGGAFTWEAGWFNIREITVFDDVIFTVRFVTLL